MTRSLFLCALLVAAPAHAAGRVDYLTEVKPILARCYACHGALQQKASLRLDTAALAKKGGDTGPAVVPGNSADSPLIERVVVAGGRRMPPAHEGEPLKPAEVATLRAWIDQGANAPADEKPEADPKDHWAFRPPVRPPLPTVKNTAWAGNPIDAFLAAGHEKRGLTPASPADRRVLLRRVHLDLIGLPPTPDEAAAFLADTRPDAYERVVERLLSSPQYGERWGRHWMDVWRYSDWWGLGAEVRNSQKHIWHWRDWIIDSVNADKGYDQMVREMLAGDELYPTDGDRLRATGFLARSYFKFNRNTWLEDTVEHTAKAFLGLTMNCAKCHDHKYDPIAQPDFYRFRAFFEPYQVRTDLAGRETDFEKNGVPRAFDCNLDAPTYLFIRGDEKNPRKKPIAPGLPPVLFNGKLDIRQVSLPPEAHSPGARPEVLAAYLHQAEQRVAAARAALAQAQKVVADSGKKTETPKRPEPLVKDDFGKARPDVWEMRTGKWAYQGGKLVQEQDGANRAALRLKTAPPADFVARFRFTTRGGQTYHSVGLSFDVAEGNDVLAYLSAHAPGPKLQIAYKQRADYLYPPGATQARPVKLNEPQELVVRVRGTLINVEVNGTHTLAYRLPVPRKAGAIELITYDAKAELTGFELAALPADVVLVNAGTAPVARAMTSAQAKLAIAAAEKGLAVALLRAEVVRKVSEASRAGTREKNLAASRAEREWKAAEADEAVARAELEAALAAGPQKAATQKKLTAARAAQSAARKKVEEVSEVYTPLRGSLKTLENNLENEASRSKPFPKTSTGRRSALATWITADDNPLAARVAVNHIWMRHLGTPLVPTVFDFGRKGTPPTHPELLDWLAVELRESGWSMKHLHRLIVTSRTYRMTSSSAGSASRSIDPENRWYWRMNSTRMEAQVIRDSLLALAGDLDAAIGGPPVPANAETVRRSLYYFQSHNEHNKFLSVFDDANVLECYRRSESVLPQQALALQNSRLAMAAAEKIAAKLGGTDEAFIRAAFETVLGQTPSAEEQKECAAALTELQALAVKEKRSPGTARATLIHALLNHNDFVTIR